MEARTSRGWSPGGGALRRKVGRPVFDSVFSSALWIFLVSFSLHGHCRTVLVTSRTTCSREGKEEVKFPHFYNRSGPSSAHPAIRTFVLSFQSDTYSSSFQMDCTTRQFLWPHHSAIMIPHPTRCVDRLTKWVCRHLVKKIRRTPSVIKQPGLLHVHCQTKRVLP